MHKFVVLAFSLYLNTAYSMDGHVVYRTESAPGAPQSTGHPMNGNMGDFNSVMNGGSTDRLRQVNDARTSALEQRLTTAQTQLEQTTRERLSIQQEQVSLGSAATAVMASQSSSVVDLTSIPDPEEGSLPYRFQSQAGEFRDEITRQYKDLYKIDVKGFKRQTSKELGLLSTQEADRAYSLGELQDANFFKELGKTFLDIAVGIDPVTGFGRGVFELFTGRNIVSGATLTGLERSFAFLSVATLGGANTARAATKMFHVFEGAGRLLKEKHAVTLAIVEGERILERAGDVIHGLHKNHRIINVHTAESVNRIFPANWAPRPFQALSHVVEFETLTASRWIRVHGPGNQSSNWIMRESSIRGLTPQQIAEKFALPHVPTYVSDVVLPQKTTLLRGNIQNVEGGASGAVQYYLLEYKERWFQNKRPL